MDSENIPQSSTGFCLLFMVGFLLNDIYVIEGSIMLVKVDYM